MRVPWFTLKAMVKQRHVRVKLISAVDLQAPTLSKMLLFSNQQYLTFALNRSPTVYLLHSSAGSRTPGKLGKQLRPPAWLFFLPAAKGSATRPPVTALTPPLPHLPAALQSLPQQVKALALC